ncbi:MAG: tetratricopeptide repeat protein [Nitrospirae bacterium]|nr:tetratricopeptide repeat protein [Nitrospirota bacterium]
MSSSTLNKEGNRLFQQGRYGEALSYYQRALDLDRRTGNPWNLAATYLEAINLLERVVEIDEKYHLPKLSENRMRLERLRQSGKGGTRVQS